MFCASNEGACTSSAFKTGLLQFPPLIAALSEVSGVPTMVSGVPRSVESQGLWSPNNICSSGESGLLPMAAPCCSPQTCHLSLHGLNTKPDPGELLLSSCLHAEPACTSLPPCCSTGETQAPPHPSPCAHLLWRGDAGTQSRADAELQCGSC